MDGWVLPDGLFDQGALHQGLGLRLSAGQVAEVGQAPDSALALRGIVTPGFIDLQVNGGGGALVNNTPTVDGLLQIASAHRGFGTVGILPTVITDTTAVITAATRAVLEAPRDAGLLGLHIEGPHIAPVKRGTHAAEHIRPLDDTTLSCVGALRDAGLPVMLTVAPEVVTPEQINDLANMGAIVSLGHTNATADQVTAALDAGARAGTHLFNAMSQMGARAPGAVGGLIRSDAALGIICDGHHVDDDMIALALAARPDRAMTFLVSDAMATVGGPDRFDLYGKTIRVDQGRLINDEGNLAGAHTTMAQGVARLVGQVGLSLEDALRMAVSYPAQVIGHPDTATMKGRAIRDCLVLDPTGALQSDLHSALA